MMDGKIKKKTQKCVFTCVICLAPRGSFQCTSSLSISIIHRLPVLLFLLLPWQKRGNRHFSPPNPSLILTSSILVTTSTNASSVSTFVERRPPAKMTSALHSSVRVVWKLSSEKILSLLDSALLGQVFSVRNANQSKEIGEETPLSTVSYVNLKFDAPISVTGKALWISSFIT